MLQIWILGLCGPPDVTAKYPLNWGYWSSVPCMASLHTLQEYFLLTLSEVVSSVGLVASYRGAFAPKNHLVQGQLHIASQVRLGNRTVISKPGPFLQSMI